MFSMHRSVVFLSVAKNNRTRCLRTALPETGVENDGADCGDAAGAPRLGPSANSVLGRKMLRTGSSSAATTVGSSIACRLELNSSPMSHAARMPCERVGDVARRKSSSRRPCWRTSTENGGEINIPASLRETRRRRRRHGQAGHRLQPKVSP